MIMKKLIALFLSVSALGGCAVGQSEFRCSGIPEGVSCVSARDVYNATNGGAIPHAAKNEGESSENGAGVAVLPPVKDEVVDTFVTPNLPDNPIPVRTPARVMRIWVASWEDSTSGALIAPGYVFTEIEPRRWTIGRPESAASSSGKLLKPLEPNQLLKQ